jgi:hypothetical protein
LYRFSVKRVLEFRCLIRRIHDKQPPY